MMVEDDAIELLAAAWAYTLVGCIGLFSGFCLTLSLWM